MDSLTSAKYVSKVFIKHTRIIVKVCLFRQIIILLINSVISFGDSQC